MSGDTIGVIVGGIVVTRAHHCIVIFVIIIVIMGCSASCRKKKDLDKNVIDPLNNNEKVIQVRDNNNVLPLKKRYRSEIQEIQELYCSN